MPAGTERGIVSMTMLAAALLAVAGFLVFEHVMEIDVTAPASTYVARSERSASVAARPTVATDISDKPDTPTETPSSPSVRILFVGDMNFDRYFRRIATERGGDHIFSCIDPLFVEADFVVGNLEGPITEQPSVSLGSVVGSPENFTFTFPTTTAALIRAHNIQVVNIGNNHIDDFGLSGVASTRRYLDQAGVAYFGGLAGDSPVHRMSVGGSGMGGELPLSFVSYNQFGGDVAEQVANVIAAERAAGRRVIVYTHWGEEYVGPTDRMRAIAALFARSGAELVVGSHPHVVQSREQIGGTSVYYSLGNFIFDQYWDSYVSTGLVLLATVSGEGIEIVEKMVRINRDGTVCPV